ncbi:MAG: hypothetical protein CMM22_00935 [Rhodospirillaceae bacterium]|nr:hypothetical protein [Rhodospirillaceae bacterium]
MCDGCAKCCLTKLENIDSRELTYTDVACHLLGLETCRCRLQSADEEAALNGLTTQRLRAPLSGRP